MPFRVIGTSAKNKLVNRLTETFNRAGSILGTGENSNLSWQDIRGTWSLSSNKAITASAATTYPISAIDTDSPNKTIEAVGVTNGAGVAFWVTDSNNWWASTTTASQSCQTCTTCSQFTQQFSSYYCFGGNQQNFYTQGCDGQSYSPGDYSNGCGCSTRCYPGQYQSQSCGSCQTCTENYTTVCAAFTSSPCNCTQSYLLRILKSVAGSVSVVASTSIGSAASAIRLITSGNNITARAYSNTSMTSQIGSDLTTSDASTPKTIKHGIIFEQSTYQQGSDIDEFRVS